MNQTENLKALEIVLESFLERMIDMKEPRLKILGGLNRLDDIARIAQDDLALEDGGLADQLGGWFAEHQGWIGGNQLRQTDRSRLGNILDGIRREYRPNTGKSPADTKIAQEIDRWIGRLTTDITSDRGSRAKAITLHRGPENNISANSRPNDGDTIAAFADQLKNLSELFAENARGSGHLMSVLDRTLDSAEKQQCREALHLSALIIYSLKQNGYLVEPFVRRLKQAESQQKKVAGNA